MEKIVQRGLHRYCRHIHTMLGKRNGIQLNQNLMANFSSSSSSNGSMLKGIQHLRRFTYNQIREMSKIPGKKDGVTPVGWKTALLILAAGGGYFYYFKTVKDAQEAERIRQRTKALGKAALGGDWELVDHNGMTRSNKDWLGKWVLLYFGFTHCPDICPEELEKLVEVVDGIDKEKSVPNVHPLFVTVDPHRDTPKAMKEYCAEYSPKILGLTGSDEQLRGVTRAYRVYFSSGPKDDDNDYIVDHTIITYLINPRGEFVDYYGQTKTPSEMMSSILNHIYRYEAGTE